MRTFATPTRNRSATRAPVPRRRWPARSRTHGSTVQRAEIRHILHGPRVQAQLDLGARDEGQERQSARVAEETTGLPAPSERLQRAAAVAAGRSAGRREEGASTSGSSGGDCTDPYRPPTNGFQVCSRDLQGFLGLFANHAYIEAPPFDRYAIITRCKPTSGSDNVLTGTAAAKTDRSPDPCCKDPNCVPCNPRPGVTSVAACLRSAFSAYNDPSLYKGLGPNSNTFAGTLARACCDGMVPKPSALGNVPGWSDPPAPARAATCPIGPPTC